ncbi:MAG TPA: Uma2 family endonuclease [Tepidisphaeraceae bacterium]|jgi:Uma2 family endonuclease|nr:Uma2 family endonuclease [Tepidisphaeraceae bacterium]
MTLKTRATIDDLYRESGKAEIVNGEIVRMSPTGRRPNRVALEITISLREYEKRTKIGVAVADNAAFQVDLPNRESFSPDAAFYVGPDSKMKFFEGPPMFAVEVRSEGDYGPAAESEMAEKRRDYFAAGTLVVWDVDILSADVIVRVYRSTEPKRPTLYRRGDIAEAEPAVPGWKMSVDDMFG